MEMQNIGIETEKKQRQIELYRDLFVGYLLFIYLFLNNNNIGPIIILKSSLEILFTNIFNHQLLNTALG